MITLAWHIFLVVWVTGCAAVAVPWYLRTYWPRDATKHLDQELERQAKQTRLAELQARERKALDV